MKLITIFTSKGWLAFYGLDVRLDCGQGYAIVGRTSVYDSEFCERAISILRFVQCYDPFLVTVSSAIFPIPQPPGHT